VQVVLVVSLVGFVLGCASPQWHRPGATEDELIADKRSCTLESGNETGVSNLYTSRYVTACLKRRGWLEGEQTVAARKEAVPPEDVPMALTFDACFERCRSLTDRTKNECFDTCLAR
jgi:hypothetical protein